MKSDELKKQVAIVFSGSIGAGKTTASKYLIGKYNYIHLSYVDLIWKPILVARNIPMTRESLQDLGDELREKYGIRELAKKIIPFIPENASVVIDDVRHPDAFRALKESLEQKVFLVYIKSNANIRVPRLKIRDNLQSYEELVQIEKRKTEITINELEDIADFVIDNEDDLDAFYEKIDKCILEIRESWKNQIYLWQSNIDVAS